MNKLEYKKILIDLRNNYLDYKKFLNDESINILGNSFLKQKEYLDSITFNLISNDNTYLNNIGNFIAYKILKKKTNKKLLDISVPYFEKYNEVQKELKRLTIELEKIANVIEFINNTNEIELEKYMSYKIN